MSNILLEVKNVTKLYNKQKGIKNVSFSIFGGEIVAIIGPNGAGKTTVFKTLMKLIHKDSGTVLFFNRPIEKYFVDIMQFVGYCPSDEFAYKNITARKFLEYSASFYEIDYKENIILLAKRLNLDLSEKIKDMSLGNKKKVYLINALFHEPKVILLDEPTNNLDPLAQNELMKILKEYKESGCAIMYSSHNLKDIQKNANRIIIIKNGAILKTISAKEIENANKKVYISFNEEIERNSLCFDGIKDLEINNLKASFLYSGNYNLLLKKLAGLNINDLNIENPSIDEFLSHYYK